MPQLCPQCGLEYGHRRPPWEHQGCPNMKQDDKEEHPCKATKRSRNKKASLYDELEEGWDDEDSEVIKPTRKHLDMDDIRRMIGL